jgi:hypothetical protein
MSIVPPAFAVFRRAVAPDLGLTVHLHEQREVLARSDVMKEVQIGLTFFNLFSLVSTFSCFSRIALVHMIVNTRLVI